MYSPSEGLREINHQLSTGVAQELIHYCNSLGQGLSDCLFFDLWVLSYNLHVQCGYINICLTLYFNMLCDMLCDFCFSDGDMDSLLDSATVDSNQPSPLSSSQESAEERTLKNTHSPKDSHTQCSKDSPSPKEAPSPKDSCSGETQTHTQVKVFTVYGM